MTCLLHPAISKALANTDATPTITFFMLVSPFNKMFNKMPSLCFAVAVCRVAMPMHPKQNLAAANRYGAPLFLCKSHQRFSLPFLRVAMLCFAFALPVCASQCHCTAVHLIAVATHLSALLSLCNSMQSFSVAILRLASPHHALPFNSFATRRRTMPPRIRAVNAMPLLSGIHLISDVGKAALSAVAPLANAPELAVIQPLTHNLFVAVVKEGHVKLASAARRDLLTVGKAHALALCGLGTQRTLAVGNLAVHMNGNHAGLNEDQAVNDLLVSGQLAAFVHGLLLAGFGLAADAGKHAASILKHAFDLVIVKDRISVRVTRENGHALISYRIRAKSRHFILDGCSIRRLAGDKLAGHIGICGPCTQHRLNKRSFHMQFFHNSNLQNILLTPRCGFTASQTGSQSRSDICRSLWVSC
nr:MAG TPA: hypothetical protein [Caudoviricetes sp.]